MGCYIKVTVINEDGLLLVIFHGKNRRGRTSNIPTLMINTISVVITVI